MTSASAVALNLDGYTDLPPGKIATIVTYLEMREPPVLPAIRQAEGWTLQRIDHDRARYRSLFRHGEQRPPPSDRRGSRPACHPASWPG